MSADVERLLARMRRVVSLCLALGLLAVVNTAALATAIWLGEPQAWLFGLPAIPITAGAVVAVVNQRRLHRHVAALLDAVERVDERPRGDERAPR